jgi:hypothetical protein
MPDIGRDSTTAGSLSLGATKERREANGRSAKRNKVVQDTSDPEQPHALC